MKRPTIFVAAIAATFMSASLAACGGSHHQHQARVGPTDEGPGNSPSSAVTTPAVSGPSVTIQGGVMHAPPSLLDSSGMMPVTSCNTVTIINQDAKKYVVFAQGMFGSGGLIANVAPNSTVTIQMPRSATLRLECNPSCGQGVSLYAPDDNIYGCTSTSVMPKPADIVYEGREVRDGQSYPAKLVLSTTDPLGGGLDVACSEQWIQAARKSDTERIVDAHISWGGCTDHQWDVQVSPNAVTATDVSDPSMTLNLTRSNG